MCVPFTATQRGFQLVLAVLYLQVRLRVLQAHTVRVAGLRWQIVYDHLWWCVGNRYGLP